MQVFLVRHGRTVWTEQHRYQGRRDVPLSPEGEAELVRAAESPEEVWVSPLSRARRTAELVFPEAVQRVEPDLAEMDFGAFEGRNYRDMEEDRDYRTWVDGGCMGRCPGGEDRPGFCRRASGAVLRLVERSLAEGREELVIVAHGGVLMAAMEALALPERGYFDWQTAPGTGYLLSAEPDLWTAERKLRLVRGLRYTKEV